MDNWVFLFSRFSGEALLLESAILIFLVALYLAYWILKKRRHGVIDKSVPPGVVKEYLAQLILDAEQLRSLLFGILGRGAGAGELSALRSTQSALPAGATVVVSGNNPELEKKASELANEVAELKGTKDKLEKALTQAQAGGDNSALLAKIKELEARLAEYSIIEDDLANLKRLQQENAQLKAQMGAGGSAPIATPPAQPVAAASPPPPAETHPPATESNLASATAAAFDDVVNQIEKTIQQPDPATPEPVVAAPPAPVAAAAPPEIDPLAELMNDTPTPAAAPQPTATAAAAVAAAPASAPLPEVSAEKSDADLVAEFEKMLSS